MDSGRGGLKFLSTAFAKAIRWQCSVRSSAVDNIMGLAGSSPKGEEMTEEEAADAGVELVLSMMASVPQDTIRAIDWWPRAKSALETAADAAGSWQHMVSKMAAKLGIDATMLSTADTLAFLGGSVSGINFEGFRKVARRDAVFIVAMAQAKRNEQRKRRKGKAKS